MLFDPHTGFIAIDEFDACFFQGVLDVGEGARLQGFAASRRVIVPVATCANFARSRTLNLKAALAMRH